MRADVYVWPVTCVGRAVRSEGKLCSLKQLVSNARSRVCDQISRFQSCSGFVTPEIQLRRFTFKGPQPVLIILSELFPECNSRHVLRYELLMTTIALPFLTCTPIVHVHPPNTTCQLVWIVYTQGSNIPVRYLSRSDVFYQSKILE